MARFLENARFETKQLHLRVDVEVVLVHGLSRLLDDFQGPGIVALSDFVFD
jgi:hypothetical protein